MLAHDVRGALNGVTGGLALVERYRLDADTLLQFERVAAAAEALGLLIADMLGDEIAPAAPARGEAVELAALLGRLERRWGGEAAEKGLALRVEIGPNLPARLAVAPLDLLRVLGNLISNAIKFTSFGSVRLRTERMDDGGLGFVLQDDGPGLGACAPERLFEYGFRRSVSEGGQGIGLHIAKTLSERMGAELRLANRPAGGVEAVVLIPASLCIEDADTAGMSEDPAPDLSGRRILLAEDNPTNQMVASQMLASLGASVAVAGDGVEALAVFVRERFDLVVVDIEMPRMSGLEVIRAIRARGDQGARTPIVALTAYAMQEHRLRIAEAGADGLISKPIVSTASFGRTVAQHLRGRSDAESVELAADNEEPAIDLSIFRTLADTIGPELMAELLDRIVSDLESVRDALLAALDPIDVTSIRTNSHILISVAGAFGAAQLRRRAADLNGAAHAGAGSALADEVRACLAEIEPALDFARAQRTLC